MLPCISGNRGRAAVAVTAVFVAVGGVRSAWSAPDAARTLAVSNRVNVVTVSAKGWPHPLDRTTGDITVIEADTLAERMPLGFGDLLDRLPGIDPAADGAWGAELAIRGLSRGSVIMLIDGARVNTATDLGARFGLIDPMGVARVEIMKGPVSSLYGSGSLGGVVNIMTRQGAFSDTTGTRGRILARVLDNPAGFALYGEAERSGPDTYAFGSLSHRDVGEYRDGEGVTVHNSGFADAGLRLGAGHRIAPRHTLTSVFDFMEGYEVGLPGSGSAPLPTQADVTYPRTRRLLWQGAWSAKPLPRWFVESRVQLYYQRIERRTRIDAFPEASPLERIHPEADHDTYGAKWLTRLALGSHDITAGIDLWQRRLTSWRTRYFKDGRQTYERPLPHASSTATGLFVEDAIPIGARLLLNTGARLDGIRIENDATDIWPAGDETTANWNAHAGLRLDAGAGWSASAVLASGYRAPTIEERYQYLALGGGLTKLGDPKLKAERSRFAELGLDWRGRWAGASVSAFVNVLDNLIGERLADPETLLAANVNAARITGLEASGSLSPRPGIRLRAVLALLTGDDTRADEPLPGIAPLNGSLGILIGSREGLWAEANATLSARQSRVPADSLTTPAWTTVDLAAGYAAPWLGLDHTVSLRVANLFDETYRHHLSSYRNLTTLEPGRSITLAYGVEF